MAIFIIACGYICDNILYYVEREVAIFDSVDQNMLQYLILCKEK